MIFICWLKVVDRIDKGYNFDVYSKYGKSIVYKREDLIDIYV